jgi:O-antigen ligase
VSIGIFGLLAFAGLLVLFFWLFVRILKHLHSMGTKKNLSLQWMTIGVGAAMLAAMLQGLVDSAFLEQDLAFCFWMLVVALLLLRALSGTPWRGRLKELASKT